MSYWTKWKFLEIGASFVSAVARCRRAWLCVVWLWVWMGHFHCVENMLRSKLYKLCDSFRLADSLASFRTDFFCPTFFGLPWLLVYSYGVSQYAMPCNLISWKSHIYKSLFVSFFCCCYSWTVCTLWFRGFVRNQNTQCHIQHFGMSYIYMHRFSQSNVYICRADNENEKIERNTLGE